MASYNQQKMVHVHISKFKFPPNYNCNWENEFDQAYLNIIFHLKTIGDGTQNLTKVFLTFSCKADSSKHQEVCSLAEGPAVGSVKNYIH